MEIEKSVKKKRDNTLRIVKNILLPDLGSFLQYRTIIGSQEDELQELRQVLKEAIKREILK